MKNGKIKVLYIAGWGRSGTTILDNILGQIDGFFSVGELHYIWDRNLIQNRLCGCGVPFKACRFWLDVLHEAFGGIDQLDVHEVIQARDRMGTRHLALALSPFRDRLLQSQLGSYGESLGKLYRAIHSISNSRVIVDSSKSPWYGYMLGTLPEIDLYIVHLIRDPRGTAYSWLRKKTLPDKEGSVYMDRYNPIKNALMWDSWNAITEIFWGRAFDRYLALRYEDFVQGPRESVVRILDLVQEEAFHLPFVGDRQVQLSVNHTTTGNPVRLQTGTVELRLDEEWRTKMRSSDKILVGVLSWPLLIRYGYVKWSEHKRS